MYEEKDKVKVITLRLKNQVSNLESIVSMAKREAVILFKELDTHTAVAKKMVSSLDGDGTEWAKKVGMLMDLLDDCRDCMKEIGTKHNFSLDLEKVFLQ
jgi:hypothetical protein